MTLREICVAAGVTRRAVQGYEQAGLVSPTGKTSRGYLLYDTNSQERIKQVRLYQQLGFSIKEIKEIIDADGETKRTALEERVKCLREEGKNIESLIDKAYELIADLK